MITETEVLREGWSSMKEFKLDTFVGLSIFLCLAIFWIAVLSFVWPYISKVVIPLLKLFFN